MNYTCAICATPFKASRPSKYCSRVCYGISKRGKPSPRKGIGLEVRTCRECGVTFTVGGRDGPSKSALFCSRKCSSNSQRTTRICARCGKRLSRRARTFCSRDCYYEHKREYAEGGELYNCDACGKEFRAFPSTRRGKQKYCSGTCRAAGRIYAKGADHPQWKGGTHMRNGYLVEADYTRRMRNGAPPSRGVHIRIAEEKIGRALIDGEHVHHLNGIKSDNRPENLLVLTSSQHRRLHSFYAREFQREHDAAGDLAAVTEVFLASI